MLQTSNLAVLLSFSHSFHFCYSQSATIKFRMGRPRDPSLQKANSSCYNRLGERTGAQQLHNCINLKIFPIQNFLDLTFDKQHKRQRNCVWMNLAVSDVVILMILNMIFLDRGPSLYFPYQVSIKSFSVLHPTPSLDKSILTLCFHVMAQSIL